MHIYLSGPITGQDLEVTKTLFNSAQEAYEQNGHTVFNPFSNGLPNDASYFEHMRADLAMLLQSDVVVFLPGWEHSRGCLVELQVASACGIRCAFNPLNFFKDV